ncbi:MAG TPA: NAD-dependent epimerase/dehydratase family protein [Thermoplasmatales archaeon]|nr:NAD-dependent epimerase/dehydratase family protein [Thermoplasmatales archaeon]
MKAVVLGGAGVMGSYAVECLSKSAVFSEILVADIDEERARKISEKSEKLGYTKADATDKEDLSRVIKGADVVVNCVGPFYKFAPPILETAIKSGVDYVDICDDYDATEKLIDDFGAKASDAGVTCIVGLGASPGITNVIAAYASSMLTSVDEIKVYVTRGIEEAAGGAIPYHMLHCWLGEIPIYKDGMHQKARGLVDGEEYARFPEPFGGANVYYFGHPETVTLPRYIKGVKNVCCKGTFFPSEFRQILLQVHSLGLLSEQVINAGGYEIKPLDFMASFIPSMEKNVSAMGYEVPEGGAVMVEVKGEYNSQPKTYTFAGTSHMREGTATPAAIGAEMIAHGTIKSHGVHAPEGCVPPKRFINTLLDDDLFGDIWMTVTEKIEGHL